MTKSTLFFLAKYTALMAATVVVGSLGLSTYFAINEQGSDPSYPSWDLMPLAWESTSLESIYQSAKEQNDCPAELTRLQENGESYPSNRYKGPVRIIRPFDKISMDHNPYRLSIRVNELGHVQELACR